MHIAAGYGWGFKSINCMVGYAMEFIRLASMFCYFISAVQIYTKAMRRRKES